MEAFIPQIGIYEDDNVMKNALFNTTTRQAMSV
jgi:hypothetical protein